MQNYIARPQSKFPGAVYRNKTQFNGKIYWNRYSKRWAIFQHTRLRDWNICQTVGPTFVSCVVWSLPHGIGTIVTLISSCHSEDANADRTGIPWCVREHGNHWAQGPGIEWTPAGDTVKPCVSIDLAQLTMNFDQRYALCTQKLNHRSHFTVGGCWIKSPSSTAPTTLLWEFGKSRKCMRLATSLLYYVHTISSCLISRRTNSLKKAINEFNNVANRIWLNINEEKTKYICHLI